MRWQLEGRVYGLKMAPLRIWPKILQSGFWDKLRLVHNFLKISPVINSRSSKLRRYFFFLRRVRGLAFVGAKVFWHQVCNEPDRASCIGAKRIHWGEFMKAAF